MAEKPSYPNLVRQLLQSKTVMTLQQIRHELAGRPRSSLFRDLQKVEILTSYSHAGHNPPFIVGLDGHVKMLSKGGLLLGIKADAEYEEGEVSLNPGDILFMYTDGVCEAMNCSEEEFGENRLIKTVSTNRRLPLTDLVYLIEKEVEVHHGSNDYSDDFTMLVARLKDDIL